MLLVNHSYPNYAAQECLQLHLAKLSVLCESNKTTQFRSTDRTPELLKRLPWHGRAHRAKRRMEQVQIQLATSSPSGNVLFYDSFTCPVAMFRYFSGSSFQCSASPVVEDKSPQLTFSRPRRFGERLTPAVSY